MKRPLQILLLFTLHSSLFTLAHAYKLPDTGQTKCYQTVSPYAEIPCAGTGQDGAYSINPMSFTDNGDGTVTDNNTGLVWQKCSMGQNNDASCSGSATSYNWYEASGSYNANYNANSTNVCGSLTLPGGGWRLPSDRELMEIVDYSIPWPGPTIAQGTFPGTVSSVYWSSTTVASNPGGAWHVDFYDGYVGLYYKYDSTYVRCVRGGQ